MRSTPVYRAARDAASYDPDYQRGSFEVAVRIDDALGRNLLSQVEGVVLTGPRNGMNSLGVINFDDGIVIAQFRIATTGETQLITMFPVGRRE